VVERNEVFERAIADRDKELLEIREAYKEKSRKCSAWEKAYSALRDQVTGREGGSVHAPPEQSRPHPLPVAPFRPRIEVPSRQGDDPMTP
jgi:hypothetical protein